MIHAYVRISVGRESESVSLEYQEGDIRRAFGAVDRLHREAASAVKNNRPVWQSLVKVLSTGDTLLAWSVDRLMRNIEDIAVISRLMDAGITIRTVRDGEFTPEQLFMFGIKGLVAVEEPRRSKQRQNARYEDGIKKGLWYFAVPFGYVRTGGIVSVNEEEAATVQAIFRDYLLHKGGITSYLPHANALLAQHDRGISKTKLHVMLRNPFYRGEISYRGVSGTGDFAPIVPATLFADVQRKLSGNYHRQKLVHDFIFRGRVFCQCGRRLIGELQKGIIYYRCQKRTCDFTAVRQEVLEECVTDFFRRYHFTEAGAKEYLDRLRNMNKDKLANVTRERKSIAALLSEKESELSGLTRMRARGEIDADTFAAEKKKLADEISLLRERLSQVGEDIPEFLESLQKMLEHVDDRFSSWSNQSDNQRRLVLDMLGSNFFIEDKKRITMRLYIFLEKFFTDSVLSGGAKGAMLERLHEDEVSAFIAAVERFAVFTAKQDQESALRSPHRSSLQTA